MFARLHRKRQYRPPQRRRPAVHSLFIKPIKTAACIKYWFMLPHVIWSRSRQYRRSSCSSQSARSPSFAVFASVRPRRHRHTIGHTIVTSYRVITTRAFIVTGICRSGSGTTGDSVPGITARRCATTITLPGGSFTKSTAGSGAPIIAVTMPFTMDRGITTTSGTGTTGTNKIATTAIGATARSENIVTTIEWHTGLLMFA